MDATVVSDASFVGMLGAAVDFKDVDDDELDFCTALIVGAKAEVLPAMALKMATTFMQLVESFIVDIIMQLY